MQVPRVTKTYPCAGTLTPTAVRVNPQLPGHMHTTTHRVHQPNRATSALDQAQGLRTVQFPCMPPQVQP